MNHLSIAQAIHAEDTFIRSPSFCDSWVETTGKILQKFGTPKSDSNCPEALFAQPFGRDLVAVVQVAGPPVFAKLTFRVLMVSRWLYYFLNDPFAIADELGARWDLRSPLPDLEWPVHQIPTRSVRELDAVLKHGDGPFLLGASQALVDGGRIVLLRNSPDSKTLRDLWSLLPSSCRRTIWPATFAFSTELRFDIVVLSTTSDELVGYLTEDQARDYPDSRYERHLQTAIESGDQLGLDRLLARRSSAEVLNLAILIVCLALGIMAIMKGLMVLKIV